MNTYKSTAPGAGVAATPADRKHQPMNPTNHNPLAPGAGILQVWLYAFTVLGRYADNNELDERIIIVQQAEVLLSELLGLTVEEFLEALCGQFGFEVLHIRRCEELGVNLAMDKLLSRCSQTDNEKH